MINSVINTEASMFSLEDRVVLVTGGRRGLGSALVDEVLRRGATKVYSTAREAYSDPRDNVTTHVLDVRSPATISTLADIATDVDVIVNNAGTLMPAALLTGEFNDVTETFDVNVYGPLRIARAFAPILAANGGGALINVLSVMSWLGGSGAYGASKAAMWSVTNSLRDELAAQHTHVLGVHAGFIDTDLVAGFDAPKIRPAVAAERIADALEAGCREALIDDVTLAVKGALSGPVEQLTFNSPQWHSI
jgi:NAD(P)-dependent dehydrogenase (short-subunit alcohol dehydrogenase family)